MIEGLTKDWLGRVVKGARSDGWPREEGGWPHRIVGVSSEPRHSGLSLSVGPLWTPEGPIGAWVALGSATHHLPPLSSEAPN